MNISPTGRTGTFRAILLGCACGVAMTLSGTAFAQEEAQPADEEAQPADEEAQPARDDAAPTTEGNDIIVTATKREQTLQDVPVAVSVTSARDIERAQIRDIKDLATLVPSLRAVQLQSSASTYFSIRGFGNGANNPGIETSVAVFVDGVYRSRTASQVSDLPDIARVEVLRGPQSTLFGKNASAGVISIVTQKPKFEFGGNVEASYGNFNAVVLKGVITGPISQNVAFSLAGGYNKRDGYIKDTGFGGKDNERNRYFVRGQLLLEPSSALTVRLIGDYDRIDENCCAVQPLVNGNPVINFLTGRTSATAPFSDVVATNFASSNKIENYGLSGQVDYEFGPITLTSITAYRRNKTRTNQDSDFSNSDLLGANVGDIGLKTFTQEVRLATNFEGPFSILLGGYFFDEKVDYKNSLTFGNDFRTFVDIATGGGMAALESQVLGVPVGTFSRAGQGIFDDFRMHDKSYSLFGNVDFKVAERLTLTAGVDYTDDRKKVRSNTISTDAFSALDLIAIGGQLIQATADPTVIGSLLNLGRDATAGEIAAFANANATNPAVNPLLVLKPLQFLPPFLNFPNAVESGKAHDTNWSYTLRAAYELSDHVNTYASYATGFKPSSYNLSRDSRPLNSDLAAIMAVPGLATANLTTGSRYAPPEKSKVFELGVKANFGVVNFNFAAFKQSIQNFQSNVFTGTGFALASAGKQSTYGFEFEGAAHPTPEFTLSMAVTYLHPKYDSFVNSALGDASGTKPAGIPDISATFGAMYEHAFPNDDHLILRGDFHYESPVQIVEGLPGFIQRDAAGNVLTDAQGNKIGYLPAIAAARPFRREVNDMNASITYALHMGLELSVWGRNLLNKRYLNSIFDVPAQTGNIAGYPNQPRTYGVAARFRF